ncbi:MAG TPA: SMC-Scp complex subunit ScpB [Planctomycetaceae bacterium]
MAHPLALRPVGWPDRVVRPPTRRFRLDAAHGRGLSGRDLCRPAAAARVEAVLMVADGPLTPRRIAQHAMLPDAADAKRAIDWLNAAYDRDGTAFRVERIAAGYRLLTRPEVAPWLDRLHRRGDRLKLSPPALETLTIVAYRQPCTRADIEAVRGVQSAEMLKYLMERGLVRIAGEHDSLGRPYLYETTKQFLELFGLRSLADLPRAAELRPAKSESAEPQG